MSYYKLCIDVLCTYISNLCKWYCVINHILLLFKSRAMFWRYVYAARCMLPLVCPLIAVYYSLVHPSLFDYLSPGEWTPRLAWLPLWTTTNNKHPIIVDLCENCFAIYFRVEWLGNLVYLIWKYTAKLLSRMLQPMSPPAMHNSTIIPDPVFLST